MTHERRVARPVKGQAGKARRTDAGTPASPPTAGRPGRVAMIAACAAAAPAFAYAVVSLYWTAGGTALLATVGGTIEETARRGGRTRPGHTAPPRGCGDGPRR